MTSRRMFLTGLLAAGTIPLPTWADAGAPDYLAAGWIGADQYTLVGLTNAGEITFQVPLPGRGHAAAAHPMRPEAVAFARRPGNFAVVIDCRSGAVLARLESPDQRHFYGHGAFSSDGRILYTTENAYDEGQGRIGIWDAARGYQRIGEVWSGGIGPHEMLRLPGSDVLVVANGGIDTHPDSDREPLNLPFMEPNLSYLSGEGDVLETHGLRPEWHLNSIRHLAVRADGLVAASMQWQGDITLAPPLLMIHRQGEAPRFYAHPGDTHRAMQGYAGSVAFSADGRVVAMSSPEGGLVQSFEADTGTPIAAVPLYDVCGLAPCYGGVFVSAGSGLLGRLTDAGRFTELTAKGITWDNHVVPITL